MSKVVALQPNPFRTLLCVPCFRSVCLQLIQNTMNRTRIYVFLGSSSALVDMMSSMDSSQLFDKGEYMVIFVDMMTYSARYITTIRPIMRAPRRPNCGGPLGGGVCEPPNLLTIETICPTTNHRHHNSDHHDTRPPFTPKNTHIIPHIPPTVPSFPPSLPPPPPSVCLRSRLLVVSLSLCPANRPRSPNRALPRKPPSRRTERPPSTCSKRIR